MYCQVLEEAEQEDKRYSAIKYAYEMADAKAETEGKLNDDLEVIAIEMADAVRSAQRDLWEKERAAKRANGNLKCASLELEKLKVKADKSAAYAMKLRAKYPHNTE
jgi:hypothetical protein